MFCKNLKNQLVSTQQALQPLQALFSALKQLMAVVEFSADGTVLEANDRFCRAVGYPAAEIRGLPHRTFCDPAWADCPDFHRFWERLRQGESFSDQFPRRHKNGATVWLEATYLPVVDGSGRVVKVVKLASDITQRMNEVCYNQNLIDSLNCSMAVIEFDLEGRVVMANQNFLDTLGYRLEEIRGQHHSRFCSAEYAASPAYRQFWAQLKRGEHFSGECERVGRDGRTVWLEATYNPVRNGDGQLERVIKFATDITARVVRHQAEQHSARTAYDISRQTE
ncbi:MAG TPA: PAS domain-containing protein, partial [Pseudogulbenkiania sp.]|nr:PAS domain-containing protein [Pseudogulbenkiania sp.]